MKIKLGQKIIDKIRGKKIRNSYVWMKDKNNIKNNPRISGLKVTLKGFNNSVKIIGKNPSFKNCEIICYGDNSTIEIDTNNKNINNGNFAIKNTIIFTSYGANVKIGKDFTCIGCTIVADNLGADVEIGDDCMFSEGIFIRSTDGHTITQNGKKINPGKSVKIGNHCWLGMKSTILKGVNLPNNCIVSAGAIVTSKSNTKEEGVIFAGNPAKIIKTGINWSRDNYDDYK